MNKTLVGSTMIALLMGLGGGYVLGYVIYRPQLQGLKDDLGSYTSEITELQNQLTNLNATVSQIENRSWHEVRSWHEAWNGTNSSYITSDLFQLKGKEVCVMWTALGERDGYLILALAYSNGTAFGHWASPGMPSADNAVLELDETGDYYLIIDWYKLRGYEVSVWDYY